MSNVVVIAPHPDDETIGCGGTLLKHIANGDSVYCIFVTKVKEPFFSKEIVDRTDNYISAVSKAYGFKGIFRFDFPTTSLTDSDLSSLIGNFSKVFHEVKPETVYCPFYSDVHSDHRVIFNAVSACTKTFRYPFIKNFLMFETASETEFSPIYKFNPNFFNDVSDYFEKKIEIFKIYHSEIQESGMPRSIATVRAIGVFRGSTICTKFAEAFQIVKMIK